HDRLVESERLCLTLGEDARHVVAGQLAAGHHRVGLPASVGRDLRPDALLDRFRAQVGAPLPGGDEGPDRVVAGIDAHAAVADVHNGTAAWASIPATTRSGPSSPP